MKKSILYAMLFAAVSASASSLPFVEPFEAPGVTNGTIDGQNGWVAAGESAHVQSGVYHSGAQSLQLLNAEVSHDLSNEGSAVWLHFQMRCEGVPNSIPVVPADANLAFFVNTNLNLMVYSNAVPVDLGIPVPTHAWIRFDVYCDYEDLYWDLSMDGTNAAAGLPLYSPSNQLASATFGNGGSLPVYVDQIDMADSEQTAGGLPDLDSDGIPDWWEQKYFGDVTGVVAGNPSDNDGLTYLETYIAGVSPNFYDPFVVSPLSGGNGLNWNPVPSRSYSVYWTTNLVEAFTWLEDIPYPQSEFIDVVHSNETTGFYRLKVQVQE